MAEDASAILLGLLNSIPTFWGKGEITETVAFYIHAPTMRRQAMNNLTKILTQKLPSKILLSTLCSMWPSLNRMEHFDQLCAFLRLFKRAIHQAPRTIVLEQARPLFGVFLESFDAAKETSPESSQAEDEAIAAFVEFVAKLNEVAFRPLFRRLYDWAFASDSDSTTTRKITFCHVYIGLLDFFKNLMGTYMSFLLHPFVETLDAFSALSQCDKELWKGIVGTLYRSFAFDDGVFWRDSKLRKILSPLIGQAAVCVRLSISDGRELLSNCLSAMADCVTDDALLKSLNLDLLMITRSEDVRLRLFALTCAETIWLAHGGKFLGFAAETATFIAECAEDENDSVVRQCRKLKDAVEGVAGSIAGL